MHREGISRRARGPGDRYPGSRRRARSPGPCGHSLNSGEHDKGSLPHVPVPVVAQTHRPTWLRPAVVLRRGECQHQTGSPRGEYYPRVRPSGGELESDRGPGARAGTKYVAHGLPHPLSLQWWGERQLTIRLRGGKSHPPRHQEPRHQRGRHSIVPAGLSQSSHCAALPTAQALREGILTRFSLKRVGAPPPPREGWVAILPCRSTKCDNTPSQPQSVEKKASQTVSPSSPVGEYPPRRETLKSTHARRRPGEDAPSGKHDLRDRKFTCAGRGRPGNNPALPLYPLHT